MRPYVITSGLLFLLILIAHVARIYVEGPGTVDDIAFVLSTLLSLGMTVWAVTLVRKTRHTRGDVA